MTRSAIPERLAGVEALRGVAALVVILSHTAHHVAVAYGTPAGFAAVFKPGHAGVDLFFVISGFVILFVHGPDIGRPARGWRYAVRRVTRILPLYWIGLAATLAMQVAGRHGMPGPGEIAWSASLLPSTAQPLLPIAWTLQFEVVFYVLFGLLVVSRPAGLAAFGMWLAVVAGMLALHCPPGVASMFCSPFAFEFFFGMAVAWLLRHRRVARPRPTAAIGTILFAAAWACEVAGLLDGYGFWARLAYGVPAALLLAGVAGADLARRPLRLGWLSRLGTASYSLYLFQFVFIGLAWRSLQVTGLQERLHPVPAFVLLAAAATAGGLAVNRLVEQPILRRVRTWSGGQPAPRPASG